MFQCLGLGTVEDGGCGEDWYHPGCLVGLGRDWYEKSEQQKAPKLSQADQNVGTPSSPDGNDGDSEEPPLPPGFPKEDEFDTFICYKCVAANPWIARYAGTEGFLPAIYKRDAGGLKEADDEGTRDPNNVDTKDKISEIADADVSKATLPDRSIQNGSSKKRKAEDGPEEFSKKPRSSSPPTSSTDVAATICRCPAHIPDTSQPLSLFLKPTFRDHLCHCPTCFPLLIPFPALLEEEPIYEPPLSASSQHTSVAGSVHNSLLERGERALNNIDRVRAIEGAMAFNALKEKVKNFLKPFAETGKVVGAEDIKNYFEELRGDSQAVKDAAAAAAAAAASGSSSGDNRKEQSG
jgi:E3 ubiquitin-protein ligase UBR7